MILKVLAENTALNDEFLYEHGLSLYIETKNHKILFDMGQSDAFVKNAEKLKLDLKEVDIAVLSHGHYDHGGGMEAFLNINSKAKVYVNKNAFKDYYADDGRYLGLNKLLLQNERIILTEDVCRIDDELSLFTGNDLERNHKMGTFGLCLKTDDILEPDKFFHEQYLLISENQKNVLISGCSHKGILNILDWVKDKNIQAVVGGFHYMKLDVQKDSDYLISAAQKLSQKKIKYYTCHCTGEKQYDFLKKLMGEKVEYICSGTEFEL